MLKFTLKIDMGNDAFVEDASAEVARILREAAKKIDGHPHFSDGHSQPVRDFNGNEVGYFMVKRVR